MKVRVLLGAAVLLGCRFVLGQSGTAVPSGTRFPLAQGWTLQSSGKVDQSGAALSQPGFQPRNWYPATVPATVVSTLVREKILPDPFFGMNLRQFPGMGYPIGANFSNLPMPPDSPYQVPWWYRTTFRTQPELNALQELTKLVRGAGFRRRGE